MAKPSETMVVKREHHMALLRLRTAVLEAAPVMAGIDNGGTWGSFTCTEIEALADVFTVAGCHEVAAFMISEHGETDEEDDLHVRD